MQKIIPFLWFNGQAEEAAKLYVSIFKKNSKILSVTRYSEAAAKASGNKEGMVMTVSFRLAGQNFVALNGGPDVKFTPAFSLVVNCATQKEIDRFWKKLTSGGGKPVQCGWLEDKYGVSWQIVPDVLWGLLDKPHQVERVMQAVITMTKFDIKKLKAAVAKK